MVDSTVTSQGLTVNADGSLNITDNAGSLTVDAVALDIRALAFATDSVDVSGSSVSISGTVAVSATNLDIRDLAFATDKVDVSGSSVSISGSVAVTATNLDIRDLAFATDKVDVSGSSVTVSATALDIRALSAATDSVAIKDSSGNAFSVANPLPVVMTSSVPGDEVLVYATSAAVAAGASHTFSYTVSAGKVLTLQQVNVSGSGMVKVEIKLNSATKVVKFSSTANPNVDHQFFSPQSLAAGLVVDVVVTNRDKQAQDLHATIEGVEN